LSASFHAAGAGGFERELGCVQPDVDAGGQKSSDFQIIIGKIRDLDVISDGLLRLENPLDEFLALVIVRMRLAAYTTWNLPVFNAIALSRSMS
jgi:hypothetical protein